LQTALEIIEGVAAQRGLALFRYIATNGVMPASRAAWLAARFDLIGLSCDGPDCIQARQRPLHSRRSSLPSVERTAGILLEAGARFEVRVTVTPDSFRQQVEIARYLCERLKPSAIRVEAAYPNELNAPNSGFSPEMAGEFVLHFLRARQVAHGYRVPWLSSTSRPGEIHAPPCQLLLQALQIIPGGSASHCFKISVPGQDNAGGQFIGAGTRQDEFTLNQHVVERLQAKISVLSASCPECFNRFHCARGCPDVCPVQGNTFLDGFRCQAAKKLMQAMLVEIAGRLWDRLDDKSGAAGCEVNLDLIA
jgi:sulfatase maturation enzyme AslB (radical SAM superfamily)